MEDYRDLPAFLEAVSCGPACLTVKISQLDKCLDALVSNFRRQVIGPAQIQENLNRDLRGICPRCAIWCKGSTLASMLSLQAFDHVHFTEKGDRFRLNHGNCINPDCDSREITLIWQGDEQIKRQINAHLGRIKKDIRAAGKPADFLDQLAGQEIMAFTQDTLFRFKQESGKPYVYIKRCLPNLAIWIAFFPCPYPEVSNRLPGGYSTFLGKMLEESNYYDGQIAFANWILARQGDGDWLNLAYLSPGDLPKPDRQLILPEELLTTEEKFLFTK